LKIKKIFSFNNFLKIKKIIQYFFKRYFHSITLFENKKIFSFNTFLKFKNFFENQKIIFIQ